MQNANSKKFTAFTRALFAANNMVLKHGDFVTGKFGQTSARWRVLDNIKDNPLTVSQIARLTGYKRQSIQRLADSLVKEQLTAYVDTADKRTKSLQITDKGSALLNELYEYENQWVERILESVSLDELEDAERLLAKITGVISEDYKYRRDRDKQARSGVSYE